ncbi:MAG: HEAT repeat domain-containing protein [Elusimicrobiota bacterium]|jgi:hypothetical protein
MRPSLPSSRKSLALGALFLLPVSAAAQFPAGVLPPEAGARISLVFVIYASIVLFWLVVALFAYMLLFRSYHRVRTAYRNRRKDFFKQGVELVLMEEPFEKVVEAFRPRRPLDADIAHEVMLESMRYLQGPPFETIREAAYRLGYVADRIRDLDSRDRHCRGRAMEALGLMKTSQAIVALLSIVEKEHLDLRLVALRALANIGDPAALPYFLRTARTLPPAMLTRVASLMLEFGPAAHRHIRELMRLYPQAFPPRVLEELLKQFAADIERPAT